MPNPDGTPTADELKNGGVPTGDSQPTQQPNPINVPYAVWNPATGRYERWAANVRPDINFGGSAAEFGASRPAGSVTQPVLPQYYEGAELMPANWDPNRIADLQRAMIAAGLIPKSANVHLGRWDDVSQKAFHDLLGYANTTGTDYLTALQQYGQGDQTNPSGQAPLTVQHQDPESVKQIMRQTAIATKGIGLSSDQIDAMYAAYDQITTAAQQQEHALGETGGAMTAPPTAQEFARQQVTKQDPLGVQEHDALGFFDQFRQMIGGWQ